jgi:hypothetical protein
MTNHKGAVEATKYGRKVVVDTELKTEYKELKK